MWLYYFSWIIQHINKVQSQIRNITGVDCFIGFYIAYDKHYLMVHYCRIVLLLIKATLMVVYLSANGIFKIHKNKNLNAC